MNDANDFRHAIKLKWENLISNINNKRKTERKKNHQKNKTLDKDRKEIINENGGGMGKTQQKTIQTNKIVNGI